jgi:hypothetical protein
MAEGLLDSLKAAFLDPTLPQPEIGEIASVHSMLASLRQKDGAELVDEYHWWFDHYPGMAAAMIRAAKARQRAELRAVLAFLRQTHPGARKAVA